MVNMIKHEIVLDSYYISKLTRNAEYTVGI